MFCSRNGAQEGTKLNFNMKDMKEIKRMTVILRELSNINIYSYRKEIKDLQKRELDSSKSMY